LAAEKYVMYWLIFLLLILVIFATVFMNRRLRIGKSEHMLNIELLKKTVVDLAEKQLVLKEKAELAVKFKISCNSNIEKLNREVSGLIDLLMKSAENKDNRTGKS
jgi:hypothetical protein